MFALVCVPLLLASASAVVLGSPSPQPTAPAEYLRRASSLNTRQQQGGSFDPTTAGFKPTEQCQDQCGVFGAERGINITFLCTAGGFDNVKSCGECDADMASKLGISQESNATVVAVEAYQRYCVTHDLYAPRASCASQCSSMLAGITEDCKNPNSDGFCGPCTQNGLTDFRICANCDANYIGAYGGTTLTQALNNLITGCPIANVTSSSSSASSSATSRSVAPSTSSTVTAPAATTTQAASTADVRVRVGKAGFIGLGCFTFFALF